MMATCTRLRALLQRVPRRLRPVVLGAGALGVLGLAAVGADALLAGPVRTWAEGMMNARLKGYTVHLARARPRIWKLALGLDGLVLIQDRHPDPPVMDLGALDFTLQWWELLHWKVAGDLTVRNPALHIDLAQIREEAASGVSARERGWQSALESIFPFKLNQVRIMDGSLLYLDRASEDKPLQATHVQLVARNVRNIDAARGAFPSPVTLEAVLFATGAVSFQGSADFLRQPYLAAQGTLDLRRIPLDPFKRMARTYQLDAKAGVLSAAGTLEYAPEIRTAHFQKVLLEGLKVDYLTSKATEPLEVAHARQAVQLAKSVRNAHGMLLQVDHLALTQGEVGVVDQSGRPPYRLFISGLDLNLDHLSNQGSLGRSTFQGRGAFMGHGVARLSGGGRMTAMPADFDVHLRVEKARLPDLNGLFMAHAGLTVARGEYDLYSEFTVRQGRVDGYLKPILTQVQVYDRRVDRTKPFGKRVAMHLAQGLADLFKNRSSEDIATVTRVSGPTRAPRTSEWQTLKQLLGNGFFRAILPGFLAPPAAKPKKTAAPPGTAV